MSRVIAAGFVALLIGFGLTSGASADGQVYCQYRYYSNNYTMCLAPPLADAKKHCEETAAKKHEQKLDCFCSTDPQYVRGYCEAPPKPVDE